MHHLAAALAFATMHMAMTAAAWAETRDACTKSCETAAKSCFGAAYTRYDACKPAANKGCATVAPANKFACLTGSLKKCQGSQSAETNGCRETFHTCYDACGPAETDRMEIWCELDADERPDHPRERTVSLCTGPPGTAPADQQAECIKRFKPTDPNAGFSLSCDPIN